MIARRQQLLWAAVVAALCLSLVRYTPPTNPGSAVNEQLPEIKRSLNESYLENDWFTDTRMDFSVRQNFRNVIATTASVTSTTHAYLIWYIVTTLLIFTAIYTISNYVFDDFITSLLTPFTVLFGYESIVLGSNWILYSVLVPSALSSAFILWSTYYFYKNSLLRVGAFLGLAALFHPLLGLLWASIIAMYYLWHWTEWEWREAILAAMAFLVLGGWNILRIIAHSISATADSLLITHIIAVIRHPQHYMPHVYPWESYIAITALLFLYLYFSYKHEKWLKKEKFMIGAIGVYCLIYLLGTEILFIPQIVKLQMFRLTPFFAVLALNRLVFEIRSSQSLIEMLTGLGFLAGLFSQKMLLLLVGLLAYTVIVVLKQYVTMTTSQSIKNSFQYVSRPALYLLIVGLITYILLKLPGYPVLSRGVWAILALGACITLIFYAWKSIAFSETVAILIAIGFIALSLPQTTPQNPSKQQLYTYVSDNTSKEAIFLIPPNIQDFRLEANRAIVVDWRSFPFSEKHILEWKERIDSITTGSYQRTATTGVYDRVKSAYRRSPCSKLLQAAKRWNASYLLRYEKGPTCFQGVRPVFINEKFRLYHIKTHDAPTP